MIGETGMVENFDLSLSSSFIRKLELSEMLKFSTIPVSPIMSLFNQFSTRSVKISGEISLLRQGLLDLSFWSFLTLLQHGIEKVERHLL